MLDHLVSLKSFGSVGVGCKSGMGVGWGGGYHISDDNDNGSSSPRAQSHLKLDKSFLSVKRY